MANPHKGEVAFKSGGGDYILSFSANAFCELEQALDKSQGEILEMLQDAKSVRLVDMRTCFWQALRDHHPDITLDQTKEILKGLSAIQMSKLLGEVLTLSLDDAAGEVVNPQKPVRPTRNGVGPAS